LLFYYIFCSIAFCVLCIYGRFIKAQALPKANLINSQRCFIIWQAFVLLIPQRFVLKLKIKINYFGKTYQPLADNLCNKKIGNGNQVEMVCIVCYFGVTAALNKTIILIL
jgi:hypothetical protein